MDRHPPKNSRNGAKTSGVSTRTVDSSTLLTANSLPPMRNRSSVTRLNSGLYIMSFHVNATSSAVSGSPSLQRTPCRSLKVHVFWSGATDHGLGQARAGFLRRPIQIDERAKEQADDAVGRAVESEQGIKGLWTTAGGDNKTPARLPRVASGNKGRRRQRMRSAGLDRLRFPAASQGQRGSKQCDARKGRCGHRDAFHIANSTEASKGAG